MASNAHDVGSGTEAGATVSWKSSYQMKPLRKPASLPVITMRPIGVSDCQPFQIHVSAVLGMVAVRLPISELEGS